MLLAARELLDDSVVRIAIRLHFLHYLNPMQQMPGTGRDHGHSSFAASLSILASKLSEA